MKKYVAAKNSVLSIYLCTRVKIWIYMYAYEYICIYTCVYIYREGELLSDS